MSMKDRVAIITGATGGLGKVISRQMAEAGAQLALFSRTQADLEDLVTELEIPRERVMISAVDLNDSGEIKIGVDQVKEKFGRIDIVIHLVGGWTGGKTVQETPREELSGMLDQHLWTTFNLAQAALPHLVDNGWGRLLVISTPFAANPGAKLSAYAAGKSAQEALMLTIAEEVKGSGITSNVLRVKVIDVQHEKEKSPSPKNAAWSTPEEISSAILYLCSDEARMINGARIPLYGSY